MLCQYDIVEEGERGGGERGEGGGERGEGGGGKRGWKEGLDRELSN